MIMFRFLSAIVPSIFLFFSVSQTLAFAADLKSAATVIHDQAEARRLVGDHDFSEYRLSSPLIGADPEFFGKAQITVEKNVYKVKGEHRRSVTYDKPPGWISKGYVAIDGIITEIDTASFKFSGRLTYISIHDNSGTDSHCITDGIFTFQHIDNEDLPQLSTFWQLKEGTDVCKDDADTMAYAFLFSY